MFWGLGRGKSAAVPATSHSEASDKSFQYAEMAAVSIIPVAPSYVLSEQRRSELLLAARTNRVSWVDGIDERNSKSFSVSSNESNSFYKTESLL